MTKKDNDANAGGDQEERALTARERGAVTFLRTWKMYQAGETAGFDATTAESLCAKGIAFWADEEPGEVAASDPDEPQQKPAPEQVVAKKTSEDVSAGAPPKQGK